MRQRDKSAAVPPAFKLLILEDVATDAELELDALRQAGLDFAAQQATRKDAFIAALRDFQPDIVITDYRLPDFNGFEAAKIAKDQRADLPVVLVTGVLRDEAAMEVVRAGIDDYVLKDLLGRLPAAVIRALAAADETRARLEAEAQRSRLARILESAKDAIIGQTTDGKVFAWNSSATRIFGRDAPDAIGLPLEKAIDHNRAGSLNQALLNIAGEHDIGNAEVDYRTSTGDILVLSLASSRIHNPSGEVIGNSLIIRDVTEQKQIQRDLDQVQRDLNQVSRRNAVLQERLRLTEEIQKSEGRFRQVVESTPNAILAVSRSGLIELANAQAERLFGYRRDQLLGRPIEDLVPTRFRADHHALRAGFFANPVSRAMGVGRDLYALCRDGTEVPVEIGLSPIATDAGDRVLCVIVDISDRKRKEERIQKALREKDVLLNEIHHRVKNNLQIIDSLLGLQGSHVTDPTALTVLQESRQRVRSMALIHQTLYESHNFGSVNFTNFLDGLVPALVTSYNLHPERINLSIDANSIELPIGSAIPCGLIVNELMSNALKYAFPNGRRGRIELDLVDDDEGQFVLSFTDNGVGIPAEVDLENPATLGLQLISSLAGQLHGTLRIGRANPTRFLLRFPQPGEQRVADPNAAVGQPMS